MSEQTYTEQSNGFMVCDSCACVVWQWSQGTHDSWHDQIEEVAKNATTAMRSLIIDLDDVLGEER